MIDFLQKNKDITELSQFKTPAKAKYYFEIQSLKDIDVLKSIYDYWLSNNLPILFIGWGTNMLFAFDLYNGIVIKNNLTSWEYDNESKHLKAFSQASIWNISSSLEQDYNQPLWHRFIGLPGSVWWAVVGNAWCFWLEIENNFLESEILDIQTGERITLDNNQMNFSYRHSILKENPNYFLIYSIFDLSFKKEKYHSDVDNIDFRENKQPKWNTCWSFFKNPKLDQEEFLKQYTTYKEDFENKSKKISSWFLLEESWLKWYHIWGAFFSDKHANFLMHDGLWTYKDLLDLIEYAKKQVKDKFEIDIEPEVNIIYNQI